MENQYDKSEKKQRENGHNDEWEENMVVIFGQTC